MSSFLARRRGFLAMLGIGAAMPIVSACGASPAQAKNFPIMHSEAEWRELLTRDQFYILREAGTERAYSSALNNEKRAGIFVCAGCANELYSSQTKYESYSGWPSFWEPLPGAVGTSVDFKIGYPRTEVHCSDCGGHLGHIFGDGPQPTGERHCINGLAMEFVPA